MNILAAAILMYVLCSTLSHLLIEGFQLHVGRTGFLAP